MGRGYIVDDAVKEYLSEVCEQHAGPITGLLIGQVQLSIKFPPVAFYWLFDPCLILQVSTYICQNMSSESPLYLNDSSIHALDSEQFHIKL